MGCSCSKQPTADVGTTGAVAKPQSLQAYPLGATSVNGSEPYKQQQQQKKDHVHASTPAQDAGSDSQQIKAAATESKGTAYTPHDSASSAHAFAEWAKHQAACGHQSLEEFITANVSSGGGLGSSTTPSSIDSSRRASHDSSSPSSSPLSVPYQPHDVVKHGPPKPACHDERNATAMAITRVRNTEDGELEAILGALCLAFKTDTACIALLTGDIICTTTACGALAPNTTPVGLGFCGWSFVNSNHELLVIEDAQQDARTADNMYVLDPTFHLGFYVGAPLVTADNHRLGTLCILGQEARTFDATRAQVLANMAEMLVRQLERNWRLQLQEQKEGMQLARSLACYDMAYMLVDAGQPDWMVIYMNKAAQRQLGMEWKFAVEDLPTFAADIKHALQLEGVPLESYFDLRQSRMKWAPFGCDFAVSDVMGAAGTPLEGRGFKLNFRLATGDGLDEEQPFAVGLPAWLSAADDGFGRSLFFVQFSGTAASSCGGSSVASVAASVVSSWSDALSAGDRSSAALMPQGCDPKSCPIEGLVMGPLLGKGSYGRVYRGVYKGVPVAVKMIQDVASLRTTADGRPLEAVQTEGLLHLGIMRTVTYAYTPDKASCWMLFEYCDRTCVQDAVMRGWFRTNCRITKGGVDLRTVALTAYEIASAMAFLHKHDIVHGDLKGGNVMLSSSAVNPHGFTAKVGDFGLARQAAAGPHCPSNTYGTVTHMPPEVLLKGAIGKPTDVYSFGVLLWEMLTTSRAWAGMRHTQIICQVALLKRQLATPAGLPPALESLLVRCLAPEVECRCTFEEVLVVLSDFLQTSRGDDLSCVQLTLVEEEEDASQA